MGSKLTDPVVVNLQGLGKGLAWVNGHSLGQYWPSFLAEEGGCSLEPCDYRGPYDGNKCISNCGQPTQRWYHVPRSFLNDDMNSLVLFEESGGNPSMVSFQTVAPGTVCGNAYDKKTMELSCQGRPISAICFASFGDSNGTCGAKEEMMQCPLCTRPALGRRVAQSKPQKMFLNQPTAMAL